MLKQILGKLPRKSSKPDSFDSAGSNSVNLGTGIQFTNGCNVVSGRLNVVKRMSSAIFPASIAAGVEAVEPHIPFKDVSNSEKQYLFVSKLNLCCSVYDFSDPDDNSTEKDLKRQTLIELVDFVASGSAKFTESAIAAMCKMSAINLFREFPPKYRSRCTRDETEDEEPMFDPAWSHLQLVYDLLLRFVSYNSLDAKVAKKYIDHLFIVRLLDLFDSEDPRERDCLKTILHRIYGKFMVHRPFIRKAVSNIIYRFVFETERHNGIAELLEIFGSVISGFAIPLKEEHKIFLCRALIPLHKPKSVGIYHQQLTYCVVQFVEKEPKLACTVIKGLLKYWPLTNSQKELMFLSELEELLEMINMAEFEKIMVPLFQRVACCLTSYHFQVAERAHYLWNNQHIFNLITQNLSKIHPLFTVIFLYCSYCTSSMSEEKHHHHLFHHRKEEEKPVDESAYPENTYEGDRVGGYKEEQKPVDTYGYSENTYGAGDGISGYKESQKPVDSFGYSENTYAGDGIGGYKESQKPVDSFAAETTYGAGGYKESQKPVDAFDNSESTYAGDAIGGYNKTADSCDDAPVEIHDYKKEEKHHKHLEHLGELSAAAAGAYALHEKHKAEKDPEHAHKHKIEEEVAAAMAVGAGGYAFHEHHEKKEAEEEDEESHGKKKHHLF